ncbi:VENN motif pre-toxin domain-containing protein [Acinetobacter baumannii]|uniref:VENN motif pre-toxin domain-containing protein n=1 Tax=Acinetobacter baumannii TaxID=470 RepID=UPI0038CDAC27
MTVGGKSTTVEQLGIHSDASTANRAVETLPNLQTILDKQKTVADATSTIVAASRTYAQDQIKNAAAEKEVIGKQITSQLSSEEQTKLKEMTAAEKDAYLAQYGVYDAALAKEKAVTQQWGMGGDKSRALNAVTTAITGALGGQTDLQVAANTLAPYAANMIGEKFGHGEDKNKAAQLASHAILGATLAYLNGGNPAAGGSAAVASEAAADYFANQYNDGKTAINPETGKFDANLLPENIKSGIRDLTAAIGAVVGGTVGDSASNAQLAGVIGQNAVENNEFSIVTEASNKQAGKTIAKMRAECQAKGINPNSGACGQYHDTKLRKDISDTSGTLSDISTAAGLYPTPASPYLLGTGTLLGTASTLLDDEKSIYQKGAEIGLSSVAGAAASKVVSGVKTLDGDRLYSETVEKIFSEASGKVAEKVPGGVISCEKNPKQIGCGK